MNILVTNPPSEMDGRIFKRAGVRWPSLGRKYKDPKDPARYVPFPFFLAYTAAILREKGFAVSAIDAVALQMRKKHFISEVQRRNPDAVVMETSTPTINLDLEYAKIIKEAADCVIIFTGPHASVFPKDMLKHEFVDYVAVGEYEFTVAELIEKLDADEPTDNIKGLAFRSKGKMHVNERRALIDPLDQLPYPARDLFPIDSHPDIGLYWDGIAGLFPSVKVQTSRGCPFKCNYCLWIQVVYPGKYRTFSPKRVVDEMEHVVERFGAKMIHFDDDTFTARKDHVLGMCREIESRKLDIPWVAMCDAIVTTRDMVKAMAKAGCVTMMFGLESADKHMLKRIGKPLNPEKLENVLKWCHEFGITTHVTNCYGLTGDTLETMKETLEFTKKLDVDSVQFSIAIPYPGTRFYNEAKEKGWLITDNWEDFDGRPIVNYPNLSINEIREMHKAASKEFIKAKRRNPKWLYNAALKRFEQDGIKGLMKSTLKYAKLISEGRY